MMKQLITSRVMAYGMALTVGYFILSATIPMPVILDVLNGAFLGVALLVALVYAPVFWTSVRSVGDRAAILAIGVGLVWASYLGNRLMSAYYRSIDKIELLPNHKMIGLFLLMALVGGILHVAAPGYPAQSLSTKFGGSNRWYIVISILTGIGSIYAFKALS